MKSSFGGDGGAGNAIAHCSERPQLLEVQLLMAHSKTLPGTVTTHCASSSPSAHTCACMRVPFDQVMEAENCAAN